MSFYILWCCISFAAVFSVAPRYATMAAADNSIMLVETPLCPATDPEWELHFAVSFFYYMLRCLSLSLSPSDPVLQAPYAQLVMGSAAHALKVCALHLPSPFAACTQRIACAAQKAQVTSRIKCRIPPSSTRVLWAWPMSSSSAP